LLLVSGIQVSVVNRNKDQWVCGRAEPMKMKEFPQERGFSNNQDANYLEGSYMRNVGRASVYH